MILYACESLKAWNEEGSPHAVLEEKSFFVDVRPVHALKRLRLTSVCKV